MATKTSAGKTLLIVGGVVVVGIIAYKLLKPAATTTPPATIPGTIPGSNPVSSSTNPIAAATSLINALKGLFGGSSTTSAPPAATTPITAGSSYDNSPPIIDEGDDWLINSNDYTGMAGVNPRRRQQLLAWHG